MRDYSKQDTTNIYLAYQKYLGYLAAKKRYDTLVSTGSWKLQKLNKDTLVRIFASKSMFYSIYDKAFAKISDYPTMLTWLENGDNKPGDMEAWGKYKAVYTTTNLRDWVQLGGTFDLPSSKKGKSGVKGGTVSKDKKKKKTK